VTTDDTPATAHDAVLLAPAALLALVRFLAHRSGAAASIDALCRRGS